MIVRILFVLFLPILNAKSQTDVSSSLGVKLVPDAIFQSEPMGSDIYSYGQDASVVPHRSYPTADTVEDDMFPQFQQQMSKAYYPRAQNSYGNWNNNGGYRPNPPPLGYSYIGYINRQARRYPVMMYTLVQCVPCQRAKHLLAVSYGDVPSHFLELVGDEDWQRQLQVDLLKVTRQATFPYVFVCGQFIGGSSDLFNLHHSGQLRQILNNCNSRG